MKIRNFSIIAHIDHGKSTLADRILEICGNVEENRRMKDKERVLDTLELEQERGITIKLQTARLEYNYSGSNPLFNNQRFNLNLIDTPGHVDFGYEVSRSIAACEGVLLLIDATQGIQAQTLTVFYQALEMNLKIIPVINKIDLPSAEVERCKFEIIDTLGLSESDIVLVSGKTGQGVANLLNKIIEEIPSPIVDDTKPLKALIYDSFFHEHKGAVALVRVFEGSLTSEDELYFIGTSTTNSPVEIGFTKPALEKCKIIHSGEVGYIATGLKDIKYVHTGDTVTFDSTKMIVEAMPGYKPAKPMVFATLFPVDSSDFPKFTESLEKLSMNDAALSYFKVSSPALGTGYQCGFLGLLHLEITEERLEREYGMSLISTSPSVEYKVLIRNTGEIRMVKSVDEFPDAGIIEKVYEPFAILEIITPETYVGGIMQLISEKRGEYLGMEFVTQTNIGRRNVLMKYHIPTNEIITDFFDRLKSVTSGYASMDYKFFEFRESDIVRMTILVNYEEIDPLSFLTHKSTAESKGRKLVEKLKDVIPRQQFPIPIQAALGGKLVARETISAYRKDVLAGMSGGHVERKKKLLEQQKKGKAKLKMLGQVEVPKEAFLAVLKV